MTEDRPKIADKVMFWQEQDRINQELIPRVLKQHELFSMKGLDSIWDISG